MLLGLLAPQQSWAFRNPNEPLPGQAGGASSLPQRPSNKAIDRTSRRLRPEGHLHAPGAHTHQSYPQELLAGQLDANATIVAIARAYLLRHSELTASIPIGQFKVSDVRRVPAQGARPEMVYLQFIQLHEGLEVEASRIQLSIKRLSNRNVLMSAQCLVYPGLALPAARAAGGGAEAAMQGRAARALQIDPTNVHLRYERRSIRYVDGRWRRVHKTRFEEHDLAAIVDEDSEDAWTEDDRLYAAIEGRVRGRAVRFDPTATGANLETLDLKDLWISASGQITATDAAGNFAVSGLNAPATVTASLVGRWATITDAVGPTLSVSGSAAPDLPINLTFNASGSDEFPTAQVNGYFHTGFIHDWIQARLPSPLTGLDMTLPVQVNLNATCNAFYQLSPPSINFYRTGGNCINTAFDTVIYHEFGHFVDDMAGGITDFGLSEGWGDVFAAFASGQPLNGEGFSGPGTFVRTADNVYQFPITAFDEEHRLGQAWSGFSWHLRQGLIDRYGSAIGIQQAEDLIIPTILANSADIPTAVSDVLLRDDDDGDVFNGTPHLEEIVNAAQRHAIPLIVFARLTGPDEVVDPKRLTLIPVSGTARAPGFARYELAYGQGSSPVAWTTFVTATEPIINGPLGVWDASELPQGIYSLRLNVTTTTGMSYTDIRRVELNSLAAQRITTNPSEQSLPDLDGKRLVWQDNRNGLSDIYLYDLATGTERRLTTDPADQEVPRIDASRTVWIDFRSGIADIYLYDLATGTERRLTNQNSLELFPAISGNRIVWEDERDGSLDIYLYDLATNTERRLTTDPGIQWQPAIDGNYIAWEDRRNAAPDIYLYDLSTNTERRLTTNPSAQLNPDISGSRVVWEDMRNGLSDIYLYDLATGTERRLTTDPGIQRVPRISGNRVVWEDLREGQSDIYSYDLETNTEQRLTNHPASQLFPNISGNRVVWQDDRNGHWDVYLLELPTPPKLTFTQLPAEGAQVSGLVPISGVAQDDAAMKQLLVLVDGRQMLSLPSDGDPINFAYLWDTTQESAGQHVLRIRAIDQEGSIAEVTRTLNVPAPFVNFTLQRCNPLPGAPPGPRCQVISIATPTNVGELVVIELSGTSSSGAPLSFSLDGFVPGDLTRQFAPLGDVTGNTMLQNGYISSIKSLSSLDVAWVLQSVVGLRSLTPAQAWRADATRNGQLSSLDAVRILQRLVGLPTPDFPANTMIFTWVVNESDRSSTRFLTFRVTDGTLFDDHTVFVPINP